MEDGCFIGMEKTERDTYKKEILRLKEQLKKDIAPKNFTSFISLAISIARILEQREATFTKLKEPILKQLHLIEGQEKEIVGELKKICEEIKEKLLTFKEKEVTIEQQEGLIIGELPKTFYGKEGGRVTFSSLPQYTFSPTIGEKEKIYRDDLRSGTLEDGFFMLDRVKVRAACKAGKIPNEVEKGTQTILSVYGK